MQMKKGTLWIGIDVAKETFEAAVDYPVIFENQSGKSYSELETKSFKNTVNGVKAFWRWIEFRRDEFIEEYAGDEDDIDIELCLLMENTGVYSTRLEETLSKIAPEHVVIQENPTLIHAYRKSLNVKNKTDAMDARVIAKYGRERAPKTKNKLPAEYLLLKALESSCPSVKRVMYHKIFASFLTSKRIQSGSW